ncbi:SDR family oxidoreductase [Curtobacterium sp. Leaf261]|uniref:SDR family oxidoreductase n=1 Tax=Curtobacterium sp. Leaf261 TaxID=1736311 RepID=UPI000701B1B1|nr:NAD(P)H-binding protein [Curtobacterium sp. Leaf261]KQO59964.1 hypothetical protein ASF23_15025 [Curtobacterium sp. Leaf261]
MSLSSTKPTLVMGARGNVGKLVLESLITHGMPVRASSRKLTAGDFPPEIDAVAADLTDPDSLAVAFEGVGQVFLYANHDGVDGVIESARTAGVDRLVLMSSGSVVHPTSAGNAITEEHREVEEAFAAAPDLTVVPIRPLVLAMNALGWAWPIAAGRPVPLYRPDAMTAPIHEADIAAVVVAALRGSDDVSDMLTGPARTSQREQVAMIGRAIGQEIAVVEQSRPEALVHLSRFMPETEAAAVLAFLDDAEAGNSPATATVEQVLGRPPVGFDVWAADHAGDFRR